MNRLTVCMVVLALIALLAGGASAKGKVFKVMVVNLDPIIESNGGKRLNEVMKWKDPHKLAQGYIDDLKECSYGFANYKIVEWKDADIFPAKTDGYVFTDAEFLDAIHNKTKWHQPDSVDYRKLIKDFKMAEQVKAGKIDEVWVFGAPGFGFYESQMCGPGAYWCNSPGLPDIDSGRKFIIMGFSYERGVGEMLEDYGHRTESIMCHVYGDWNHQSPKTNWDKFSLYDKVAPGRSGCGNVHYAPNTPSDYKWGDTRYVYSTCDDWLLNWPNLQGTKKLVNCTEWGNGEIRAHHRWWFKHFPHANGINPDGKQNNWWKYMADFNSYPESR